MCSSDLIGIFAAAVADYRAAETHTDKLKKSTDALTLRLEPTVDILREMAQTKGDKFIVGFAAETSNLAQNAKNKLAAKNLDLIVANDVTAEGAGFDHDTNAVSLFGGDGRDSTFPKMDKSEVANRILDEIVRMRSAQRTKQATRPSAV